MLDLAARAAARAADLGSSSAAATTAGAAARTDLLVLGLGCLSNRPAPRRSLPAWCSSSATAATAGAALLEVAAATALPGIGLLIERARRPAQRNRRRGRARWHRASGRSPPACSAATSS